MPGVDIQKSDWNLHKSKFPFYLDRLSKLFHLKHWECKILIGQPENLLCFYTMLNVLNWTKRSNADIYL